MDYPTADMSQEECDTWSNSGRAAAEAQKDVVQVTTGADAGDDFVGLYDLDGDQIQLGNETWTVVGKDEVSPDTIAEVEGNWECGLSVVTRLSL